MNSNLDEYQEKIYDDTELDTLNDSTFGSIGKKLRFKMWSDVESHEIS